MSSRLKTWILYSLLGFLLLANAFTILSYWKERRGRRDSERENIRFFLTRELDFDSSQERKFGELIDIHRGRTQQMRPQIRKAKEEMFALLQKTDVPDSVIRAAAARIGQLHSELELISFEHFSRVRAICDPEQKVKFDGILHELLRLMSVQRPPGLRPGTSPRGNPAGDLPPASGRGEDRRPPPNE